MHLINSEACLTLILSDNILLTVVTTEAVREAQGDNLAKPAVNAPANATF